MEVLGAGPGPVIGKAYQYLLELRLENGPMSEDAAVSALREWWESQSR
jgi:poly(A) polymerase